jgi:hypothetical protein
MKYIIVFTFYDLCLINKSVKSERFNVQKALVLHTGSGYKFNTSQYLQKISTLIDKTIIEIGFQHF